MRRHDSFSMPPGGCGPLDLPLALRRLLAALVLVLLCFLPARVPGDWVTKDEHDANGELILTRIAEKFERTAYHLRHLTLQSSSGQTQTIPTTNEHPMYVPELGIWIRAADVEVGQSLNELPGSQSLVTATRQETHRQGGVKVYNFRLAEGHTYFVRVAGSQAEPVWVHNTYDTTISSTGGPVTRQARWLDLAKRPFSFLSKELRDFIMRHDGEGVEEIFGQQLAHRPEMPNAMGFDYADAVPATIADHLGLQHRYLRIRRTGITISIPRSGTVGTGRYSLPRAGALPG